MTQQQLITGHLWNRLAEMPAASVHCCVTDPPYELGFMGKTWDRSGVSFDPATWQAIARVLKPGGYLLAFGGTRTVHRIACAIEDAGFEIRDQIAWMFGSGMPKSKNRIVDGVKWGTGLKPAYEPIIVARLPFRGTVAANMDAHGTAAINVDGCRIPSAPETDLKRVRSAKSLQTRADGWNRPWISDGEKMAAYEARRSESAAKAVDLGRWPANVILDEEAGAVLDLQTGNRPAGSPKSGNEPQAAAFSGNLYGTAAKQGQAWGGFQDTGGASRFFYCPKADRAEREIGMDGVEAKPMLWSAGEQSPGTFQSEGTNRTAKNNHPTVKPIALMQWLVRLVTPPGGIVLDPFMGSGSTGIACSREGFDFIGIDLSPENVEIARLRIYGDAPMFANVV